LIRLIVFLIFTLNLYGVKLLDINTFTNQNYTDLKISLDGPYQGKAIISKENDNHLILLKDITSSRAKEVAKETDRYKFIRVFPEREGLLLKIREKETPLEIEVSKSKDLYTIRLRITPKSKYQLGNYKIQEGDLGSNVPDLDRNYLISAGFVGLLLLLWILVKLISKRSASGNSFFIKHGNTSLKVEVQVQKILDPQNKIVQINIAGMNYLVLVGQNNMLLDKFSDPKKENPRSFNSTLKNSQQRLDSLIK